MLIEFLSALLLGAVIYDLVSHRLPNYYLLLGLLVGFAWQAWAYGWSGVISAGAGLLTGFALFVPLYVLGGMAAGDVKLMAVVGSFLGATGALWAGAYSLIVGSLLGILYLLYKGHLGKLVVRYWAMAATRSRIAAEEGDAARHRFPYAIAIAAGTLLSLYWTPI
ncbi:prepilin peptidase CpaA [Pseudomonas linyingensis]|uniref:Prepilin peptidase CpaA n=1 Tax=Pseudomonas linyingensis TaxID=915471 RepID=A0A1H6RWQ8_9PSED|nr:prepilin peptidase [Pseudomonas linyingensis]SEI56977.1 prepilin peptidase CpaA [Pseudomonas linyingensis]